MQPEGPLRDRDGRRLTPAVLQRGMIVNIAAGALGQAWFALALSMPLTMFFERVGASGLVIGLAAMVQNLAMVMQVPSAVLAERVSSRKRFWFAMAFPHRLLWFIPVFLAFFAAPEPSVGWAVLWVVSISSLLASTCTASWYSWIMDLVPERVRGRFWAFRQSVTMAANLFSMLVAGWLLDATWGGKASSQTMVGFGLVFTLAAVVGCADIVLHMAVPDPEVPRRKSPGRLWQRLSEPFHNRDFLWVTLAFGVWNFSLGFVRFADVYLKRECAANYSHLSAVAISTALGCVVASFIWSKIMDRIGNRTVCMLMFVAAPVFGLAWLLAPSVSYRLLFWPWQPVVPGIVLVMCVVNFFAASFYSCTGLVQITLCSASTVKENRTMAMALHWTAVGVMSAAGPVVGGLVMDALEGAQFPFRCPFGLPFTYQQLLVILHMLVGWLVALPLLRQVRRNQHELPVSTFLGNPLRVFGLVQNIMLFSGAVSEKDRARAISQAGSRRLAYVVNDLQDKLEDPSMLVREETVAALGRIGTTEAVQALLQKLADPDSDLDSRIVRALRTCRQPGVVEALLDKLPGADNETRREIALALGCLGDRRAAEPLRELLRQSGSAPVLASAGEALASLGELQAVYDLVARMRVTGNPMLRRSLAVAAGDLLGRRGAYYALLTREEHDRGGEAFSQCLKVLRNAVQKHVGSRYRVPAQAAMRQFEQLEEAYVSEDLAACAALLYDLAFVLGGMRHGLDLDLEREVLLDLLVSRDARFGVGVWYLHMLANVGKADLELASVLLGVHFLRHWVEKNPVVKASAPSRAGTGSAPLRRS
ncbi:MAG: MFS transporter [Lentisphaeria bacterium]|nr:MFS transporter [Lentisphaeria bacterium]